MTLCLTARLRGQPPDAGGAPASPTTPYRSMAPPSDQFALASEPAIEREFLEIPLFASADTCQSCEIFVVDMILQTLRS